MNQQTNEVETNPAVSHQETIQRLIREIDVVFYVLKQQIYIFRKLLPHALPIHDPFHPPENPIHPQGRVYPEAYRRHDPVPVHEMRIARERPEFCYETKKEELPYTYAVADSDNGYAREQDGGPRLSSTDPGGFRELLVNDCQSAIYQRIEEFKSFKRQAHDLGMNVSNLPPLFHWTGGLRLIWLPRYSEPAKGSNEKRSPRTSNLRLHHSHHHILAAEHHRWHLRHEHNRHSRH